MNRPIYETDADRAGELRVANTLAKAWSCTAVQLPKRYPCDLMLLGKEGPRAWVEVKRRTYARGKFPTYHISVAKVCELQALSERTDLRALLAVQLTDALLVHHLCDKYPIVFAGRTDRNDAQDREPVFEIPFDAFVEVLAEVPT